MATRTHFIEHCEPRLHLSAGMCFCGVCQGARDAASASSGGGPEPLTADDSLFVGGRWGSTALDGNTGSNGTPVRLTWSFAQDGVLIPPRAGDNPPGLTVPSTLGASMNAFGGGVQAWFDRMDAALNNWEFWTGLTFFPVFDDGAAWNSSGQLATPTAIGRGDMRIFGRHVDGAANILAYNFFPGSGVGGDMVIDTAEMGPFGTFFEVNTNARAFRNTHAHEVGHGIGLQHVMPRNNTKLMEPNLSTAFEGPQFHDIRLMQGYYGDPFEKTGADLRGRNDTMATANAFGALPNGQFPLSSWNLGFGRSIADTGDVDFLSFQISGGRKDLAIAGIPFGTAYERGQQDGAPPTGFFPTHTGNLTLALFNSAGQQITSSDATGVGEAEGLAVRRLEPGTYFLRVGISSGSLQTYDLVTNVADYVPQAPSTPDLTAASDSGASDADNITNDNTPTFTGTAEFPGQEVLLYDISTPNFPILIGSTAVDANRNWSITTTPLGDGGRFLSAFVRDSGALSGLTPAVALITDTAAPAAPNGLRLRADFDTGVSDSDGITNFNRPRFTFNLPEVSHVTRIASGLNALDLTTTGAQDVQLPFALADGPQTVTVFATDLAGNSASDLTTVVIDTTAPQVVQVVVAGTQWTAGFLAYLQSTGQGRGGYAVPFDNPLDELPWVNLDRFLLVFNDDVLVQQGDLSIRGVNTPVYNPAANGGFAYNAATTTATWTVASALSTPDKLLLDLDGTTAAGRVTDLAGNVLDGDLINGGGGNFQYRLQILPGDVNRNGGIINALDVQQTRLRQFTSPADPGTPPNTYTAFHDVNGSGGIINALDVQLVRLRQFSQLPEGVPTVIARPSTLLFSAATISTRHAEDESEPLLA